MKDAELHRLATLLNEIPDNGEFVSSAEILDRLPTTYGGQKKRASRLTEIRRDLQTIQDIHPELEIKKRGRQPVMARWPINRRPPGFGLQPKPQSQFIAEESLDQKQLFALVYLFKVSRYSMPSNVKEALSGMLDALTRRSAQEFRAIRPGADISESNLFAQRWLNKIQSLPERIGFLEPEIDKGVEEAVHKALLSEQGLSITYRKSKQPFNVYPVGLVQQGVRSYLVAFKSAEPQPRTYLVARIGSAVVVPSLGYVPTGFDLERFLVNGIASPNDEFFTKFDYGREIALRLWIDRRTQWIKETKLSYDQICEPTNPADPGGDFILTATVKLTENLVWWILSMSWNVEVLEPENLRQRIKADLQRANKRYTVTGCL